MRHIFLNIEEEHVRIILSHVHGENVYLDRSHTITKEAIHAMTSFWQIGEVPKLRTNSKETMIVLTQTTVDDRAISVNNIIDPTIIFITMVIGYQIVHLSKMNSVTSGDVHATYRMIVENADCDLWEAMRS